MLVGVHANVPAYRAELIFLLSARQRRTVLLSSEFFRPPGTVVLLLVSRFFPREISELRRPISARLCRVIGS